MLFHITAQHLYATEVILSHKTKQNKKKQKQNKSSSAEAPSSGQLVCPQNCKICTRSRKANNLTVWVKWTLQIQIWISLKPNSAPHLLIYSAPNLKNILLKLNAGVFHHDHYCLCCFDRRWGKHGSTWVAVSGGRRRERILTDANLFCVHALMCVNRQSRPWDQCGRARIISMVWTEPSSSRCWHDALAAVDTRPSSGPPTLSRLIIRQLLTLTRLQM